MPSSSPTFRLTYFPYKGYAEGSRLLAKFLNIDFEEQSIDPDAFGWESLPVGFDQIQRYLPTSTNKYKTRREQTRLPLTWLNPVFTINQSLILNDPTAIGYYLINHHCQSSSSSIDLLPTNVYDRALALQYSRFHIDSVHAIFNRYKSILIDSDRKSEMINWFDKSMRPHLINIDSRLRNTPFILDRLTWCDFYLYNNLQMIFQLPTISTDQLSNYSAIDRYLQSIEQLPTIVDYVRSRSAIAWIRSPIRFRRPYHQSIDQSSI